MSSSRINELKLDIEDFSSLLKNATRQKSKDLLSFEIKKLQSDLVELHNEGLQYVELKPVKPINDTPKCYDIKLNNYAWDQSDNFVKLYVTLDKVKTLPDEAIRCDFDVRSLNLCVTGLENKNYTLTINNLCGNINVEKSYLKVKTDMIVIFLSKEIKKTWSHVTYTEKILKEAKTEKFKDSNRNDKSDDGMMDYVKKIYQNGDDEMKRTIARAWTESQQEKKKTES